MGIRGAWSLVSDDPRRFGEPWSCSRDTSIVWIDGPSLLFFLALQPKFDHVETFHSHLNQYGQASPSSIHVRTTNFITVLSNLSKQVHVVMDGDVDPSINKESTQIDRIKVAAQSASDASAQSTKPMNCNVLSILAEWTMIDAIDRVKSKLGNVSLHRPRKGEAEQWINEALRLDGQNHSCHFHHDDDDDDGSSNVVIFSNDTDFLFYQYCPGFVPFRTLQFTPSIINNNNKNNNQSLTLSGFHYMSSNFVRAFVPKCRDYFVLSTIAALAGCDYDDHRLVTARNTIVKSPIGGLRPKHQSKPSSRMSLTAVLRFVVHHVHHHHHHHHHHLQQSSEHDDRSWLDQLVQTLGDPRLRDSLFQVHQVYFNHESCSSSGSGSSSSSQVEPYKLPQTMETMRLCRGAFYCRPLMEKWDSSNHRSKKSGGQQRRKRQCRPGAKGVVDKSIEASHVSASQSMCWDEKEAPLDYKATYQLLKKQSAWMLPNFQRFRLVLFRVIHSHSSAYTSMMEWRRVRTVEGIDFKPFHLTIPPAHVYPSWEGSIRDAVDRQGRSMAVIGIALSLLPLELRGLWLLLVSVPESFCFEFDKATFADDDPNGFDWDMTVMNLVTLACFHAQIAVEVLSSVDNMEEGSPHGSELQPFHDNPCLERLNEGLVRWIWNIIESDEDSLCHPQQQFFQAPQVVRLLQSRPNGKEMLQTWSSNLIKVLAVPSIF